MADGHNERRKLEIQMRKSEAIQLRISGMSYRQIADAMHCSDSRAHEMVQEALRDIPAPDVEALRKEQDAMIRSLYLALVPRINKGEPRAIEVALKLLERLAKLHGLDAPTKQIIEVITEEAVDKAIRELEEQLRLLELPEGDYEELDNNENESE